MNHNIELRPKKLNEYVGKKELINSIKIGIDVFKKTQKPFEHCLFYGPPGVGKTTLAQVIANEMKSKIKIVQAISIQTIADLISIINSIQNNDVLFIDEFHNLSKSIAEILYPVLEENVLDIIIGKAYNSKIVRLKLPQFTLIGATTFLGEVPKALEDRFNYIFFIDTYSDYELKELLIKNLNKFDFVLNEQEINLVIENSRGIPRNCNRILKRIQEYRIINKKTPVRKIIHELGYVYHGLSVIDLKYMNYLIECQNYRASLKSIAHAINLDEKTITEKIEPYLIKQNYIEKKSYGRSLKNKGVKLIQEYQKI